MKNKNKQQRFNIRKRPKQSSNVFWWRKTTRLVATINDQVNKFEWAIYIGKDLQPALDHFTHALNIKTDWKADEVPKNGHFFAYRPYRNGAIWFEKPPNKAQGLIAHECLHAVMYLIERMDSKATEDQEEFIAYYLGFLVDQVHEICKDLY